MEIVSKANFESEILFQTRKGSRTWTPAFGENYLLYLHSANRHAVSSIELISCEVVSRGFITAKSFPVGTCDDSVLPLTQPARTTSRHAATTDNIPENSYRHRTVTLSNVLPLQTPAGEGCYLSLFPLFEWLRGVLGNQVSRIRPHTLLLKVTFANGTSRSVQVNLSSSSRLVLACVMDNMRTWDRFLSYKCMLTTALDLLLGRHVDGPIFVWMHAAICSFLHEIAPGYNPSLITRLLQVICSLRGHRAFNPVITLAAVGHVVAIFSPTQRSTNTAVADMDSRSSTLGEDLWNVCREMVHIPLTSLGTDDNVILHSFAVQLALTYLVYIDRTSQLEPYTYASFSTVIPLQLQLKVLPEYRLKILHFVPIFNRQHSIVSKRILKFCEPIDMLVKAGDKSIDNFIAFCDRHGLSQLVSTACNSLFDLLAGEVEAARKGCRIWLTAKEFMEGKLGSVSSDDATRDLCNSLLPIAGRSPDAKKSISDSFKEACRVWGMYHRCLALINQNPNTLTTATKQYLEESVDNILDFEETVGSVQAQFAILHQRQESMVSSFRELLETARSKLRERSSPLRKLPTKLSLNEVELLFSKSMDLSSNEVVSKSFLSSFPDNLFMKGYEVESVVVIVPLPPLQGTEDIHGVVLLDSNMVRVVKKHHDGAKQIVAGGPGGGCAAGVRSLSRLYEPKGFCFVPSNAGENCKLGLIADTGNHCIRGVILNATQVFQDEVLAIAGVSQQNGHVDGPATSALFNLPRGMAALDGVSVLICDYGNHALRILKRETHESNHWVVSTVAGRVAEPGEQDGDSALSSHLQFPNQIVASPLPETDRKGTYRDFYFTEHGPSHAIRCYRHYFDQPNLSEIFTLHRGEPFIHLQGLCVGQEGTLLVCDSGAGCVWSVDIATKTVSQKISADFVFDSSTRILRSIHGDSELVHACDQFAPTSIVHLSYVTPGLFLIASKGTCDMLFKYFDPSVVKLGRKLLLPVFEQTCVKKSQLLDQSKVFLQERDKAQKAVFQLTGLTENLKAVIRQCMYRHQILELQNVQFTFVSSNMTPLPSFLFVGMLNNAPDLESAAAVVRGVIAMMNRRPHQGHGHRRGHMGMTGRERAQAYGLSEEERAALTNYDTAFDIPDIDDFDNRAIGDSREMNDLKDRLVEMMENFDFSTGNVDPEKDLNAIYSILKMIDFESAANIFMAILRNKTFNFNVNGTMIEILAHCFGLLSDGKKHADKFQDDFHRNLAFEIDRAQEREHDKERRFRSASRKLKEPVLEWLSRILPAPKSISDLQGLTFEEYLLSKLIDWVQLRSQTISSAETTNVVEKPSTSLFESREELFGLSMGSLDDAEDLPLEQNFATREPSGAKRSRLHGTRQKVETQKKPLKNETVAQLHQVWRWLATTHFEIICKDDLVTGKVLVRNDNTPGFKYKDTLLNRSESFLQSIVSLCRQASDSVAVGLIANIGSSLCKKYVGPEKTLKILMENVYAQAGANMSVETNTDANADIAFACQVILTSLIDDAFAELLNRKTTESDMHDESVGQARKIKLSDWQISLRLVSSTPALWSLFIEWMCLEQYKSYHVDGPLLNRLYQVAETILAIAHSLSENIVRGHVDIDTLRQVSRTHSVLRPLWGYAESPLVDFNFVQGLCDEMTACEQDATNLGSHVLPVLLPASHERSVLSEMSLVWKSQFIATIRQLFRRSQHPQFEVATPVVLNHFGQDTLRELILIKPLPQIFCGTAEFLTLAVSSEMFKQFWEDQAVNKSLEDIAVVIGRWGGLLRCIVEGDINVLVLDRYGEFLMKQSELSIFVRTGTCIHRTLQAKNMQSLEKVSLNSRMELYPTGDERDTRVMVHLIDVIQKWNRIRQFYINSQSISYVISASRQMIAASERYAISNQDIYLKALCKSVDSTGAWSDHTLKQVLPYTEQAKLLDSRLLNVSYQLLLTIQSRNELIVWLRSISDDEVFSSSIEIARSLQEINAPVELWDPLSGRVAERFLSMVSNIRSYLHSFLYSYEPSMASFESFLQLFSGLNRKTDPMQIVHNIDACHDVRVGLSKIIGTKVDISGASRLAHLYSTEASSLWKCTLNMTSGTDCVIALKYKVAAEENEEMNTPTEAVWRQHSFNDLMEFQNNIVLDRAIVHTESDMISDESTVVTGERSTVDSFLIQFSLVRKIKDLISSLFSSGHFNYSNEYMLEIPVTHPEEYFRSQVTYLEKEKNEWDTHVTKTRQEFYFINYFDIRRCLKLVALLNTASSQSYKTVDSDFVDSLKGYVCFLNPEIPVNNDLMASVGNALLQSWNDSSMVDDVSDLQSMKPNALLTKLGRSLDQAFCNIPQRIRPLIVPEIDRYIVSERIKSGVHVAFGKNLKAQYDQLLTICAIQQRFVEWETCVICRKSTTFEQIALLLYRWYRAASYRQLGTAYILVEVENLSFDVQFSTVQLLSEMTNSMPSGGCDPFILISDSNEHCYLTTQYQSHRINNGVLPTEGLTCIAKMLCNYGLGVSTHTSRLAGAGKSFDIRLNASITRLMYTHVPINSQTVPTKTLINRINENLVRSTAHHKTQFSAMRSAMDVDNSTNDENYLIHFDVASTCSSSLVSVMFNLCVLNVLADVSSDSVFSFHPQNTKICIELAAGLHFGPLSQLTFYPTTDYVASAASFVLDMDTLRRGMADEFSAHLYGSVIEQTDEEVVVKPSTSSLKLTQANAYDRLFYVLEALHLLDRLGGTFPHDFDSDMLAVHSEDGLPIEIPHERAFHLLIAGSGLQRCPSLWCVWNFINVMYWQLQEMHHTSSPLYLACMPDDSIQLMTLEFDTAMKHRVKGEMIKFMIKTAREFATRQTTIKELLEPDRVVGVLVKELSFVAESTTKDARLLFWRRENYDNDGYPVFKSPTFYHSFTLGTAGRSPEKAYHYFIHFRESENRWVIDDTVQYTGGVIAYSQGPQELETAVFELRNLKGRSINVEIRKSTRVLPSGQSVDIVTVKGFESAPQGLGSVAGPNDNGVYVQLPGQDINGKPHYYKEGPDARHLYFLAEGKNRWVIAKTCNAEVMGANAYSPNDRMESTSYIIYPPNSIERKATFQIVRAGNAVEILTKEIQGNAAAVAAQVSPSTLLDSNFAVQNSADENKDSISTDQIAAELENAGLSLELAKWRDSNHECVFFNNDTGSVNFLSTDVKLLQRNMHPVLLNHLKSNKITVGDDLQNLNDTSNYWDILANVTGVRRSPQEVNKMFDNSFCLTGDSLLKLLAIVFRLRCKIPVVLLGECGCGKTMLLAFLCKWLGVQLLSLDVHGGTTESDIISIFEKAEYQLVFGSNPHASVFVFLDEVNTCAHMGLLNEIICHRSIYGRRLHDGIQVLAALNPYRTRPVREGFGLTFNLGTNPLEDPMNKLVYRVHPIPSTLKDFLFDFGSLESATELLYIQSMLRGNVRINAILRELAAKKPSQSGTSMDSIIEAQVTEDEQVLSMLINGAQGFIREVEGDPSVVSLRDVKRVLVLFLWFYKEWTDKKLEDTTSVLKLVPQCAVLALAHVYCYRLPSLTQRAALWETLSELLRAHKWIEGSHQLCRPLVTENAAQSVLTKAQEALVSHLEVEDGISMNQALTENLFVSIIAILNKIPIFIVGKPGTSKTLALQVIQNNLQGRQSPQEYWRDKPSVHIFQYQCSPLSTSHSIQYIFEAARSFQEHSSDSLTVLLLDEVGLAENSPDLPLKVLHYMLVDPPVSIIGLSNWTLDSSKMNRAICLQRPEPSEADIIRTGHSIISSAAAEGDATGQAATTATNGDGEAFQVKKRASRGRKKAAAPAPAPAAPLQSRSWLESLGKAFLRIYNQQKELLGSQRDFIGMRDYYSMLKYIREYVAHQDLSPKILISAVARNFGGHPEAMLKFLPIFYFSCFPSSGNSAMQVDDTTEPHISEPLPSAIELVQDNLKSTSSRNLMVLSKNDSVLNLLFGCGILNEKSDVVLIGSRFRDDMDEFHLIQQINKVKQAMAEGTTAVLLNNDNIYESLYDVLNQRFVTQRDSETGHVKRLLRLAMGSRSQLCPVEKGFKLVVVVQQAHAYEHLDLPLLNRFEKQIVTPVDALQSEKAKRVLRSLESWCDGIMRETRVEQLSMLFCGVYADTLPSLVLSLTHFDTQKDASWSEAEILRAAQIALLRMAAPIAVLYSTTLKSLISEFISEREDPFEEYMRSRSNIFTHLRQEIESGQGAEQLLLVATKSPVNHFEASVQNMKKVDQQLNLVYFQLAHVTAERNLTSRIDSFYENSSPDAPNVLAILCDPLYCHASVIAHARYLAMKAFSVRQETLRQSSAVDTHTPRYILFVIHLPPGVSSRTREFALDFYPPWKYSFIDDLSLQGTSDGPSLMQLLRTNLFDLCTNGVIDLHSVMLRNFQSALAQCHHLKIEHSWAQQQHNISYVKVLFELLKLPAFADHIRDYVLQCLRTLNQVAGVEFHIFKACENLKGSLKQAVRASIDNILINCLAHVIRHLDTNFRLNSLFHLVFTDNNDIDSHNLDLWLRMSRSLQTAEYVARLCPADLSKPASSDVLVHNNSLHGAHIARFPFSDRIIASFSESLREALEQKFGTDISVLQRSLRAVLESSLGTDLLTSALSVYLNRDSQSYLTDFVISTVSPQQYVKFDDQFAYVQTMMSLLNLQDAVTDPTFHFSPDLVHAKYWSIERGTRFFSLFSAWSSIRSGQQMYEETLFFPVDFEQTITRHVADTVSSSSTNTTDTSNRLRQIDIVVVGYMLQLFLDSFDGICRMEESQQQNLLRIWGKVFSLCRKDLENLLALTVQTGTIDDNSETELTRAAYTVQQKWWLLNLLRAISSELMDRFELGISVFATLRNAMQKTIDPTRSECLDTFIQFSSGYPQLFYPLTKCYIKSFLLPEFNFLTRLGSVIGMTQALVKKLATLLLTLTPTNSDQAPPSDEMDVNDSVVSHQTGVETVTEEKNSEEIALHRSVIDIIFFYYSNGHEQEVAEILLDLILKDISSSFRITQLFSERLEDAIYNSSIDETAKPSTSTSSMETLLKNMTRIATINDLHLFLSEHPLELPVNLSHVKTEIASYADSIIRFLVRFSKELFQGLLSAVDLSLLPTMTLPEMLGPTGIISAQIYFLKYLFRRGGKQTLLLYLRLPQAPVLLPDVAVLSPDEPMMQAIDPFSSLVGSDPYYGACALMPQLRHQYGIESVKAWFIDIASTVPSWNDRLNVFIAALSTQLYRQPLSMPGEGITSLIDWLREQCMLTNTAGVSYQPYFDVILHTWNTAGSVGFNESALQMNLKTHILIMALSPSSGWLSTLFIDPKAFVKGYLPSMIDDEFAIFRTITDSRGNIIPEVGWYECPNGHKYSVGNCMRPMEISQCPGCGVQIGGRDHVSVQGVRDLRADHTFGQSLPGYALESTAAPQGYNIVRLGKLSTVILRFIIHSVMLSSFEILSAYSKSTVAELMYPNSPVGLIADERIQNDLRHRLTMDWNELRVILDMEEEDIAMGLHIIINSIMGNTPTYADDMSRFGHAFTDEELAIQLQQQFRNEHAPTQQKKLIMPPANMSPQLRAQFEQKFEIETVSPVFASTSSKRRIREEKAKFQSDNVDIQLTRTLGDWSYQVLEMGASKDPFQYTVDSLWRFREVVTFDEFSRTFRVRNSNQKEFPVLAAVLQHESSLPLIKFAAHILAWHSLLFRVFPPGTISRAEASILTNRDIILRLPEQERAHAELTMNKFCEAFNAVITQPGNLRECAENVFVDPVTGRVDLDMSRGTTDDYKSMSPDTSISFSLPSSLKDGNEFVDPRALCTLFILEKLKTIQETVVEALLSAADVTSAAFRASETSNALESLHKNAQFQTQKISHKVPLTSYLTPASLIARRLLSYDRNTHLMPSVNTYFVQSLEPCRGELVGFDFKSIEADLRDALLPSAQPLAIAVIEFSFQGETTVSGAASRLSQLIPQIDLPAPVLDQIWEEVDTEDRLSRVLMQLDDCVAFIASSSGTGVQLSGDTKLSSFALEVLMVDEQKWLSVATTAMNTSVQLKHIRSLMTGLHERRMEGNVFKELSEKFKKSLSPQHKKALQSCMKHAGSQGIILVAAMRAFLLKLMQSGLSFDTYLYYNLLYVDDSDLDECSWFSTYFPKDLTIEYAWETFLVLDVKVV